MNFLRNAIHRIWTVATMPDYVMGLAPVPTTMHMAPLNTATPITRSKAVNSSGH